jgi:hypothetical protein
MANRLPRRDRLRDHPLMAEPEEPEYCDSPGPNGCGSCPSCADYFDWKFEEKRDRELEER